MKNTESPFYMTVKIKKNCSENPCDVEIDWNHNHPVQSLQALSFKDMSMETAEKCKDYFKQGLSR